MPGQEVAKTVLLRVDGSRQFIVAVLPASKSINFEKASKLLGKGKVHLATKLEIAAHCPDGDFGVLPPFGSHYGMKTIVDSSLADDFEIVFKANTHNEAIRMKYDDFAQLETPLLGSFAQ